MSVLSIRMPSCPKMASDPVIDCCELPCGIWELNSGPVRAVRAFNHWTISLVLNALFLKSEIMLTFVMSTIIKLGMGSLTMLCFGIFNQVKKGGPVSIMANSGDPESSFQCVLETGTWGSYVDADPSCCCDCEKVLCIQSGVTCALPCPWYCGRLLCPLLTSQILTLGCSSHSLCPTKQANHSPCFHLCSMRP